MAFCCLSVTDNCTAIVLSIAILLSGLRVSSSAPTGDEGWWINPCNKQPTIARHGRSAAESELNGFLFNMDTKFFKEVKDMYKSIENVKFRGNCPRINNMLIPIQNATSYTSAMQAFYETLLQFAVFIDKLKNTPVKTKGEFDTARRKRIFEEAKVNLKRLICEYNDTLSEGSNHREAPNKITSVQKHKTKVRKINMKCLPASMNHTQAHFMDFDFFRKLQKFLKQSRRILKLKKKGKKSANKIVKRKKKPKNQ
ncbi:uncharacterized protein LOC108906694 isoform X2 [Anoplophora glabripennis]|uniref:uncharacterized protein LOC108906694 isoform X2 n=1 Tax=Anoplophora glabripennis TaxID=217634 RepID=UPI000873E447|nr:uncharacterized protein LOC108906694 isoform X2 [Anoplophora glabripennis]